MGPGGGIGLLGSVRTLTVNAARSILRFSQSITTTRTIMSASLHPEDKTNIESLLYDLVLPSSIVGTSHIIVWDGKSFSNDISMLVDSSTISFKPTLVGHWIVNLDWALAMLQNKINKIVIKNRIVVSKLHYGLVMLLPDENLYVRWGLI